MNSIKVSILVTSYNVESYIEECLQSLLSQTLKETEIVVVDDGSTDRTIPIIEKYSSKDNRIHLIRLSKHQGVSNARNVCLTQAIGKYFTFVDSDDTISSTAVEKLYNKAEQTNADIVLASMLYCYTDKEPIRVGDKSSVFTTEQTVLSGQESFISMQRTGCYVPMICGNLYLTHFVKTHPQLIFKGMYHEDEYFTPYALIYASRVTDIKHDFYFYRQRPDSIMRSKDNLEERMESLSAIGRDLQKFIQNYKAGMPTEIRQSFKTYGKFLCKRAYNQYEKILSASKKKCVLIFSTESIGAQYGVGTYIRQLAQCFPLKDWNVNIITLNIQRISELEFHIEDGIAWYDFPIYTRDTSIYNSTYYEEKYYQSIFYFWASRIGDGRKIFCHFNFTSQHYLALLFKEKLQASIVFTLHYTSWSFDLMGDRKLLNEYLDKSENHIKKTFEKEKNFMLDCCDRVIAIAKHSYTMIHELYGLPQSKISYIPNGLICKYREYNNEEKRSLRKKYHFTDNERIIIFAGRLEQVKGVNRLLAAFKDIQKINPEARLIIAGTGNFAQILEEAYPCWKQVTLTGFVPKETLYELYAIADVGVVPSIHEEFGYVAIEMMLNKLPVIVHNTTGLSEIADNGKYANVFQFPQSGDTTPLKDAILNVLNTGYSEKQLQSAQKRIIKDFSIDLFRKRIIETYTYLENPDKIINNL